MTGAGGVGDADGVAVGMAVAEGVARCVATLLLESAAGALPPQAHSPSAISAGTSRRKRRISAGEVYGWYVSESIQGILTFHRRTGLDGEGRRSPRVAVAMAYPWTRVPEGAPPLDPWQLRLLPIADLFMGLMWSRPGGLSLRTTWVTPATIWLGVAALAMAGAPGLFAIGYGIAIGSALYVLAGVVALVLALGAGAVAVYGIRQRFLSATR